MSRENGHAPPVGIARLCAGEQAALAELGRWLRTRFGNRLRRTALFGSRARGQGSEDSDLDVLVVVDDLSGAEAREIHHWVGDLLTRHDVLVTPLAVSRAHHERLLERERRIALEIERDGIPL